MHALKFQRKIYLSFGILGYNLHLLLFTCRNNEYFYKISQAQYRAHVAHVTTRYFGSFYKNINYFSYIFEFYVVNCKPKIPKLKKSLVLYINEIIGNTNFKRI